MHSFTCNLEVNKQEPIYVFFTHKIVIYLKKDIAFFNKQKKEI
jgi:hypothetical protein